MWRTPVNPRTSNAWHFTFLTRFGSFEVLGDPGGIRSYEELRATAQDVVLEGIPVKVASLDHLIAMKRQQHDPRT
jgi:hypothetical protein